MNIRFVTAIILAATAATTAFADGDHGYPNVSAGNGATSSVGIVSSASAVSRSGNGTSKGKTREQVQEELIQAYRDGLLPISEHDYPPGPATIARNKTLHNLYEPKWAAGH